MSFFSLVGVSLGAVCFSFFFPVSYDVYLMLLSFWNDVVLSAFQVPYASESDESCTVG